MPNRPKGSHYGQMQAVPRAMALAAHADAMSEEDGQARPMLGAVRSEGNVWEVTNETGNHLAVSFFCIVAFHSRRGCAEPGYDQQERVKEDGWESYDKG